MKFKKIVGFGDSWIWGDELLDPALIDHQWAHPVLKENIPYREGKCFLGLLGQHYGVPVENFGLPGGSLQSSVWTYLWWLEHEQLDPTDCLVIVGHTSADRESFYNPAHVGFTNDPRWNKFVHSSWVHSGSNSITKDWSAMIKQHTTLTSCSELAKLNYLQTVKFFEGQDSINQNTIQLCTIQPPVLTTASNLIWPDSSLSSMIENQYSLQAENGHPNELGHEFIRDQLILQLNRVILTRC